MTRVIAEVGVNHMGSVVLAERMFDMAADAGCWGVKLQLYIPELLDARKDVRDRLRGWMLDLDALKHLRRVAGARGLAFGASCFDNPSVDTLEYLEPDFQKTACGQQWPTMRRLQCLQVQSYTHMDTPEPGVTSLICVPQYPCRPFDYLPVPGWALGISDHTHGGFPECARGMMYAEVHVMAMTDIVPPDAAVSLNGDELRRYVEVANTPVERHRPAVRTKVALNQQVEGQTVAWLRGV